MVWSRHAKRIPHHKPAIGSANRNRKRCRANPPGSIAELASEFDDPMPDDIFEFLRMLGGFGGEPTQNTFSAGGPYLYRVYTEHQRSLGQPAGVTRRFHNSRSRRPV